METEKTSTKHSRCNKILFVVILCSINFFVRFWSEIFTIPNNMKESPIVNASDTSEVLLSDPKRQSASPATDTANFTGAALPPVHWHSSWLGNQWIPPPGYHTFNPQEMLELFPKYSILILGDSTARRTYGTWNAILQQEAATDHVSKKSSKDSVIDKETLNHWSVIDVGKGKTAAGCRRDPALALCNFYRANKDATTNNKNRTNNHTNKTRKKSFDLLKDGSACLTRRSMIDIQDNLAQLWHCHHHHHRSGSIRMLQ